MKKCVAIAAQATWTKEKVMAGLLALTALALVPGVVLGAGATATKDKPAAEAAAGMSAKRVTLTAKAVDRLGIKTGPVREETVVRKHIVGGEIVTGPTVAPMAGKEMTSGAFGVAMFSMPVAAPAAPKAQAAVSGTWIRVAMSEEELSRVVTDQPVQIVPLAARPGEGKAVTARSSKLPPFADPRKASVSLHYVVDGSDHKLTVGQRVRVGMALAGSASPRKVVPYSAVFYDSQGQSWVYANPEPNVYVRQKVGVEFVEGDLAILTDGPAKGTQVATVGAMLLFGAEAQAK